MSEKTLSIFIDESGDFGPYDPHTPLYLVAILLHDQHISIAERISAFETHLTNLGYPQHAIHTGPLIRRESVYSNDLIENRKKLFNALFNFTRKLNIHYACAKIKKIECRDAVSVNTRLSKEISDILHANESFWNSYDKVIIYYDNGQIELTKILISVFSALYTHVEFRKVKPVNYKLFQVADLICTMELLSAKAEANAFSRSELEFFGNVRSFKKNYFKHIQKKKI